ncbi:hypothetical protein E1A91_A11G123000v1 [Gossypium mustelinum]|uniref:Uncharacterized protein n=1 Tax=Gossypium mustelinum TaxID=34275 RepID=A0A5D2X5S2_GOSMU|nr:hypothetical protein E1A91_A11G123000v1 [Gossypium mustelinum]
MESLHFSMKPTASFGILTQTHQDEDWDKLNHWFRVLYIVMEIIRCKFTTFCYLALVLVDKNRRKKVKRQLSLVRELGWTVASSVEARRLG